MKPNRTTETKTALARRWEDGGGTWWWAIVVIVVPVVLIAAAAVVVLLLYVGPGTEPQSKIDVIKVGLSVGAGTGGVVALVLTGRRQSSTEHDATERRLTELYVKAVEQLGCDKPTIRHGGLYALERVAQDNPDHREVVVDVICAYLRAPFRLPGATRPRNRPGIHRPLAPGRGSSRQPAAGEAQAESPTAAQLDDDARQEREVRLTAQRILAKHLNPGDDPKHPAKTFWKNINLDLTSATLINLDLAGCHISEGRFPNATFMGIAWFDNATITGDAWFDEACFTGDTSFSGVAFSGSTWIRAATFTSDVRFTLATFAADARFDFTAFTGNAIFHGATFTDTTDFSGATFTEKAAFNKVKFARNTYFDSSTFNMAAEADDAHARADSTKLIYLFPSWPLGWTAELPDLALDASMPAWTPLTPVPVVLSSPGQTGAAQLNQSPADARR